MNNIEWKRIKALKELDSIEEFEKEKDIRLPDDLKELVLKNNGARPSLRLVELSSHKELEIKALLSFNKDDIENIYNNIDFFKLEFNGKILPFATESSGDYFCIDLGNKSIVYWEHETNEIKYVASNLDEFLAMLK